MFEGADHGCVYCIYQFLDILRTEHLGFSIAETELLKAEVPKAPNVRKEHTRESTVY
jgi:hypothetical protein